MAITPFNKNDKLHDTNNITSNHQRTDCDLQNRIRTLHALRDHTRTIHQATYFYSDLNIFLAQGTLFQFQSYVDKYKPIFFDSLIQRNWPTNNQLPAQFHQTPHNIPPWRRHHIESVTAAESRRRQITQLQITLDRNCPIRQQNQTDNKF
jgi:hypothetical protein